MGRNAASRAEGDSKPSWPVAESIRSKTEQSEVFWCVPKFIRVRGSSGQAGEMETDGRGRRGLTDLEASRGKPSDSRCGFALDERVSILSASGTAADAEVRTTHSRCGLSE